MPSEENIYLKKDFLGWRVVEPIKDPQTGKIIVKNIFNKKGFALLFFLLLILGSCYLAYKEQINNYRTVISNPCSLCSDCNNPNKIIINSGESNLQLDINLSKYSDGK